MVKPLVGLNLAKDAPNPRNSCVHGPEMTNEVVHIVFFVFHSKMEMRIGHCSHAVGSSNMIGLFKGKSAISIGCIT
jgi:hypothetical protein